MDKKLNIAIVDDNRHDIVAFKRILGKGCPSACISCFYTAEEAWSYAEERGSVFDVLITDMRLPGLGGVELCRRMRQEKRSVWNLLVKGDVDVRGASDEVEESCVDACLYKDEISGDPKVLVTTIEKLVWRESSRDEGESGGSAVDEHETE